MIVIENLDHIGLCVSNLDRAIEFYKELFGFDVVEKITNSHEAFVRVGDIVICIKEVDGYKAGASKNYVTFYVDEEDFEDAVEELAENDIEIVQGPENIRGGKTLVFADPDGNLIGLTYPGIDR